MKRTHLLISLPLSCLMIGIVVAALMASNTQNSERQDDDTVEKIARTNWEYARLVINADVVLWHAGETNVIPEPLNLDNQYRRLGGNFRANLTNLLNLIGSDGWELVATDEMVWTFKRPRL